MKKILMLIAAMSIMGFCTYAQNGSGACKLPGTNDYVNVDYYNDGHLAVSVQSDMKITQLRIKVICEITWKETVTNEYGDKSVKERKETKTLCDKTFYDIAPNQTSSLREGVQPLTEQRNKKYNYSVSVGNPICKPM